MIAAMDTELAAHMHTLSAHVSNAGAAHRETLRRLDSLLGIWGQRLQGRYEDAHRRVDAVQKLYETTLQEFEAFASRYESVQQQLRGVEQQYEGTRQEQEQLLHQMRGLQEQFEATLQQCQALLDYEQQFKDYTETMLAFEQHLAGNTAEFARLRVAVRLAMAASILALIVAGYVGFGKPGWPLVGSSIAAGPPR